ncbi:MAG: methyltransferase domain-containing protein [Deltaproteobacteria bacterium]|nr:methyltransferase domain-containing protein [Deltaproteobacteria bacterium]
MSLSEKYWDDYYRDKPLVNTVPSDFFKRMVPRLQKGKVLDVGMGDGVHAVYLAGKGFGVKGVDISSVAVERALKRAAENNVVIEAKRTDLDMYLFGLMEYDSLIMTFFRPSVKRYYSEMVRSLKQGGTLLVESCTVSDLKEIIPQDEDYRNWYFKSNELLHHLQGMRILFYHEGYENGRHVLQCLAEKPLDRDVAKYNAFDMKSAEKKVDHNDPKAMLEALFKKK